jgi:eukaryotic-like serine/threonine-protein kinase
MTERDRSQREGAPSGSARRRHRETPADRARIGGVVASSYRIDEFLGRGAIGAVFGGVHLRLDRPVAVKFVDPSLVDEPQIRARFQREAKIAAQIGSSHAVEVFDYGLGDDGAPYLVMERLVGEDLHQRLQRDGPLPLDRALRIAKQVCRALAAAHDNGIVHRDLKPENVFLVQRDGEKEFVKVVDFGLSTFVQSDDTRLTRAGQSIGTPLYMAPEQAGAAQVDARVDVYSLGVLLFEMTTGRLPFEAPTLQALLVALSTGTPRSLRYYDPSLPQDLDELVVRFMARDPNGRPKSAAAALAEIMALEERLAINLSSGRMEGASPAFPSGTRPRERGPGGAESDLVPATVPAPEMEAAVRSTDPALPLSSTSDRTRPMNRAELDKMIAGGLPLRDPPMAPPSRPSDRKLPEISKIAEPEEIEEDSGIFYGRLANGKLEELSKSQPSAPASSPTSSPTLPVPTVEAPRKSGPPRTVLWLALAALFLIAALVAWRAFTP